MSNLQLLELASGIVLVIAGGYIYWRRSAGSDYGSQSGVLLLIVGALITIHALGLFEYRPSQAEIEHYQKQGGS
jgi:hypothetical protein